MLRRYYEVVMHKREEGTYLVTGNKKHFPVKTFIVNAREFVELLKDK